jgi:molybdenum cofactor cytidylyltransferase
LIAGVVLAAGAGRRFGARKQLADLEGRPLLEHALLALAAAPLDRTFVVLGAGAEQVRRRVPMHGADPIVCDAWQAGLGASLRTGLGAAEAAGAEAVAIVLGDQPLISPRALARTIEARGAWPAVRATYGGEPGHPVLLERRLFAAVRMLRGEQGARELLAEVPVCLVPCDDAGSAADVDTPLQLEWARAAQRSGNSTPTSSSAPKPKIHRSRSSI